MKTYAETKGQKPFNWYEALNKENISQEEWDNMQEIGMVDWRETQN